MASGSTPSSASPSPATPSGGDAEIPVKDAVLVSNGPGKKPVGDALLQVRRLSFTEHVFIWILIVLVGVVFGVGSSWVYLTQNQPEIVKGIPHSTLSERQLVGKRLEQVVNLDLRFYEEIPEQQRRYLYSRSPEEDTRLLQLALRAADMGLMPDLEEKRRITDKFLDGKADSQYMPQEQLPTRGMMLAQAEETPLALRRSQIETFLAQTQAAQALMSQHIAAPALAASAADAVVRVYGGGGDPGQQIVASAVVLSAGRMSATISAQDPAINALYEKIKGERYTLPKSLNLTLAWVDVSPLTASAAQGISMETIKSYYDNNLSRFILTATSATAPARYRSLTEVANDVRTEMAKEAARELALAKAEEFSQQVESSGLLTKDAAAFRLSASQAGLRLLEHTVDQSETRGKSKVLSLGPLGYFTDNVGLFEQTAGYISLPIQTEGRFGTSFLVRINTVQDRGFIPLDTVRNEVWALAAARSAYGELVQRAQAIARKASYSAGLNDVMASPEQAMWGSQVTAVTLGSADRLDKPGAEVDAAVQTWTQAGELTMPGFPVLVQRFSPDVNGAPQVRLLQLSFVKPLSATAAAGSKQLLHNLRSFVLEQQANNVQKKLLSGQ